jgi:hypothetical protein
VVNYIDVTRPGAGVRNIQTNVTPSEFGQTLEENGFTKSTAKDGTPLYTKGDMQYSVYSEANSTGEPTAQVKVNGEVVAKIRLQPEEVYVRWVEQKEEFDKVFLEAKTCVYVDSGRYPTTLRRLIFDDAEICTTKFANLLQHLMGLSGDSTAYYIVLEPDPVHYFHRHFGKYPVLEITRDHSAKDYLAFLNADPGGSPADAVGTNWWACVIVPLSSKWFVHALRDSGSNGGHLWIPPEWVKKVAEVYPYVRSEPVCIS